MSDSDGIEEAVEMTLRVAVMAAAQLGERRARERETAAREAESRSAADARELATRLEAERGAARAVLAPTSRDGWWESASSADISTAYERAATWADTDPEIERLKTAMDEELRSRYGLEPAGRLDSGDLEQARQSAAGEARTANRERAEAAAVMATADTLDRTASAVGLTSTATVLYDSAERRDQFARDMMSAGIPPELVEGRIVADLSQGAAATDATAGGNRLRPGARKARTGSSVGRQHSDRGW